MTQRRQFVVISHAFAGFGMLALLAACSSPSPKQDAIQESRRYVAQARGNYVPPGPSGDPWGPYIREASTRFDMPEKWIRSLMKAESGGRQYAANGQLITSHAGAMGLMQVMPGTYDELRERHNLGDDPFHPRDNILAGVAYMREMYDIYGAPGFLAAYNAGPGRLDDYLTNNRALPDETRRYVAIIGPNLAGADPLVRSPAEQYAMNVLPMRIPPGTRYGRATQLASAAGGTANGGTASGGTGRTPARAPVEVAQLPDPPRVAYQSPPQPQRFAALVTPQPVAPQLSSPPPARSRFQLIPSANAAESNALRRPPAASGQWAIQVGAFTNQTQAQSALGSARDQARSELTAAQPQVASLRQPRGILWRARMVGLSRETAVQACGKLTRAKSNCIVLSPDAQS